MVYPKSVYLDYGSSSNERFVTPEGYEAIKQLIIQYQICGVCRSLIDQADHLLIGRNLCLSCLLKKQSQLTFLGPIDTTSDGDLIYGYSDEEQLVYTSQANSSSEAHKDIYSSIQRAGFQIPHTYIPFKGDKDNPIKLGRYGWSVFGKLTNSVIVLSYSDTYPTVSAVFLSYKDGQVVELNKRNHAYKQMFERAKAVIESTKHRKYASDYYMHPDGYEISQIHDSTLYPIIAQFESAIWDVQRQLMPKPPVKEGENYLEEVASPVVTTEQSLQVEETSQDSTSEPLQEPQEAVDSTLQDKPQTSRKRGRLSVVRNEGTTQEEEAINAETTEPMQQDANEGQALRDLGEPGQDVEVLSTEEVQAGSNE